MTTTHVGEGFHMSSAPVPLRQYLGSLWRSRALIRMLTRRDFFVRYRGPAFGILWTIIVPFIHAIVLATIFSYFVRFRTGVPFAAFVLAGIIPWQFFSNGVTAGATSITGGSGLASKVYFPRAVLSLTAVGSNFYGFIPAAILVIIVSVVLGVPLGVHLVLIVPAILLMIVLTLGFALVFGALNVYYRDVAYIIQAVTIAWFYGSAVFFPLDVMPSLVRNIVLLNPATGMVQLFRSSIIGPTPYLMHGLYSTMGFAVALLIGALLLHRRFDRVFVDLL